MRVATGKLDVETVLRMPLIHRMMPFRVSKYLELPDCARPVGHGHRWPPPPRAALI